MARQVTGVDVGTRTARFLKGYYKGNTFHATGFSVSDDPGDSIESTWESAEPSFKPVSARVGITGREMNLRYTRVPRVPDWQLRRLMRFEVEEVGGSSGAAVASEHQVRSAADHDVDVLVADVCDEDGVVLDDAVAEPGVVESEARGSEAVEGPAHVCEAQGVRLEQVFAGHREEDDVLPFDLGHVWQEVEVARDRST